MKQPKYRNTRPRKTARRNWPAEHEEIMRREFPHVRTADLAKKLGREYAHVASKALRMGLKKSPEYLASPLSGRLRSGSEIGKRTRFTPGHSTWNKGKKGVHTGGIETQFKKGEVPHNYRPVGSTRIDVNGYVEIKVGEGKFQWRHLHREVWKEHHGEYPPKGFALVFKDGNKQNCAIENLELVSRGELMKRNTIHRYPPALKDAIKLAAKLRRAIDEHQQH